MDVIQINEHIVADPNICHGKPTFKGTRIMVWQILDMLTSGQTSNEIIEAFPSLTQEHITAALNYATSLTRENKSNASTQGKVLA
jgi:uncharacterized protein (DUF433 family)